MRRYSLIVIAAAALLCSCYSWTKVRLVYRYDLSSIPHTSTDVMMTQNKNELRAEKIKYLAGSYGSTPSVVINNRAVHLCTEGKFPEAEILLLQIDASDALYAAARNNLGVVYESAGDMRRAAECYLDAVAREPDNEKYRFNYMTAAGNER